LICSNSNFDLFKQWCFIPRLSLKDGTIKAATERGIYGTSGW